MVEKQPVTMSDIDTEIISTLKDQGFEEGQIVRLVISKKRYNSGKLSDYFMKGNRIEFIRWMVEHKVLQG